MHLRGFAEDEVTTIQGLQHRTTEAPPRWYPIPLQLRYKATSEHGPLYGFGQTRMMSSKGIIFGGGNGLKPGMKVEIAVAWPPLLDRHIRLQLVLEVTITGTPRHGSWRTISAPAGRSKRSRQLKQPESEAFA
jgi:hypothetical protein